MVKIRLEVKFSLENLEEIYTNHPEYSFALKLKCLSCGEATGKWHDIAESDTFPSAKSDANFIAKCKFCSRESSIDIIEGTNGTYKNCDQEKFVPLVTFDCRGWEPVDFKLNPGWIALATESAKVYEDIDLREHDWIDYDVEYNQPVRICDFEFQFVKVK